MYGKWHNLRKDPKDLPVTPEEDGEWLLVLGDNGNVWFYDMYKEKWNTREVWETDWHCSEKAPAAWCDIPKFKEELMTEGLENKESIFADRGNGKPQRCLEDLIKLEIIKEASTETLLKELKDRGVIHSWYYNGSYHVGSELKDISIDVGYSSKEE